MNFSYSSPAVAAFIVLPAVLAALFLWGVIFSWRRSGADDATTGRAALLAGLLTFAWMAVTWTAALVAVQAFRLPLELAMHAMSERGIMPGIMS